MTTYRSVSVLTIVRGRQAHLDHLIAGLSAQVVPPDELVISYMQAEPPKVPEGNRFPVRFVKVDAEPMPLAAARNRAAEAAQSDVLAFLDVDCIPDPEFVRRAAEALTYDEDGVYLPEVRYLPGSKRGWFSSERPGEPDYARLTAIGQRHPSKAPVADCPVAGIEDFGELWGLAFILAKANWTRAGGMDERFIGYGAEETDFAQRLKTSGAHLYWVGGTICFHQHHHVHKPPLQHFDSIIRNARLYRSIWGKWCMEYWLDDFERRGHVRRSDAELSVVRRPTESEIAETRQGDDVLFS